MAWQLEKSVVRGELFNLRPNHVHGWIELQGAPSLVHLGLTGNMEGELFGKRVQFETELADEDDEELEDPGQGPGARGEHGLAAEPDAVEEHWPHRCVVHDHRREEGADPELHDRRR